MVTSSTTEIKPLQRRLLVPLVVGLLVLIGGFVVTLYLLYNEQLEHNGQQQIENSIHTLEMAIDAQTRLLVTSQQLVQNDPELPLLLQGNRRQQLIQRYQPRFDRLRDTHGITHFYFHTADGANLLRLHQPERYGDTIRRTTFERARDTQALSVGFESGPLGTFTLRVVSPVVDRDGIVGYLELGSDITRLLNRLHALENIDVGFLVHEDDSAARSIQGLPLPQHDISDRSHTESSRLIYSSDPELARVLDRVFGPGHAHHEVHSREFPIAADDHFPHDHLHKTGLVFKTDYKHKPALLSVIPFIDVDKIMNADLVLINDISGPAGIFYQSTLVAGSIATLVFLLLVVSLHTYLKAVDQSIQLQHNALLIANDRLDKAISVATSGTWDWNLKTHQVHFDDRYYTMAGYQPGDFPSSYSAWVKRIHPDDAERVETAVNDYLQNRTDRYDVEFRFRREDDSYMWIRARGKIFDYDDEGEPLRFIGTHSDITERKQAELLLSASEERFRSLVETTSDWVWEIDANGVFTYTSPRCEQLLGFRPDEILGKTPFDLMRADEAERVGAEFARIVEQRAPIEALVNVNRRKDGIPVVLETSGVPFFDRHGELAGYRGIDRDISERQLTERQLRESEHKYRVLVENQTDMVVEVDTEGRFLFVSPSYCALFDKRELELLGNTFMPLVHEEDQQATQQEMAKLYKPPHHCYITQRALTRDGWRWLEWIDTAVLDEQGEVKSIIGVGRDITDRIEAEQALRDSESRYRVVFNQQYQFMAMLSAEGIALEVNDLPLQMAGITREDVVGKPFWDTPFWQGLEQWKGIWKQRMNDARESTRPVHGKDVYLTSAGEERFADSTTTAIFGDHSELLFYLVQASDTTERQKAERERDHLLEQVQNINTNLELRVRQRTAELHAVNKELEAFSYSVSHDLRAPLRAIDGFSQALLEDYRDRLDETAQDYLDRVRNSAQRMGRLIDDLLQLSRVNRDQMTITNVDLSALAHEVIDELRSIDPERNVTVAIGENLRAKGDPRLSRIMLDNLLGNAWKFSSKQAEAHIEFDRSPEHGEVFFVRDNGVGFNMQHADKLFGAFQRLHRTTEFPGTGIGLATVQRVLNRHGGHIWAEAAEGQGATFYFSMHNGIDTGNSEDRQQPQELTDDG